MIKTGGINVSPAEVEAVLTEVPEVELRLRDRPAGPGARPAGRRRHRAARRRRAYGRSSDRPLRRTPGRLQGAARVPLRRRRRPAAHHHRQAAEGPPRGNSSQRTRPDVPGAARQGGDRRRRYQSDSAATCPRASLRSPPPRSRRRSKTQGSSEAISTAFPSTSAGRSASTTTRSPRRSAWRSASSTRPGPHGRFVTGSLQTAAMAVATGMADVVACVNVLSFTRERDILGGPHDFEGYRETGGTHAETPHYGLTAPAGGAALAMQRYMALYGTTGAELAAVPVAPPRPCEAQPERCDAKAHERGRPPSFPHGGGSAQALRLLHRQRRGGRGAGDGGRARARPQATPRPHRRDAGHER